MSSYNIGIEKLLLLHKRAMISRVFIFLGKAVSAAIILALLLTNNGVRGQSHSNPDQPHSFRPSQSVEDLLPDHLGERWRAVGQAQTITGQLLSKLPDADVYQEYGLQRVITRVYANGKLRTPVEVFEMKSAAGAYGLFTFNRGHLPPGSSEINEGLYVVRISNPLLDSQSARSLLEAIKPNLVGDGGQLPTLPLHLPEQNKVIESEKYIVGPIVLGRLKNFGELQNAINFAPGVEVMTADYHNGDGQMGLIVVEYYTPQLASDGYTQLQNYFDNLSQNEKDRSILKRTGNYVVAAVNIQDEPAAQHIISQIKYEIKVYWAGRKLSDIPLEFRPDDPVAVEEAKRTVQVLLRSFYWIGSMLLSAILLGLIAGWALFYWHRYRRRKLGLDDLFSDAGGTVRLNLSDYSLSEDYQISRSIKGDREQ